MDEVQRAKDKAEAIIADALPDDADRDLVVILVARGYMRGYIEGMEHSGRIVATAKAQS